VVVGEVVWLLLAPRTSGYQQWAAVKAADGRRDQQAAETAQATRRLDDAYTARVNQLGRVIEEIRRMAAERGMDPAIFDRGGDRLQALVQTFIQMSALHQRLVRFLGGSPTGNMEEEVARLSKEMTAEKDAGVRLTLRQTLTVAQRRQKQHDQIEGTRRALEAKMRTLEMSMDYLRSQVFAGGAEADLENQLDELSATVSFLPDLEAEATATIASARSSGAHPSAGAPVS
jgi:outer membrane murein-binding lipoprotein Lpp